MSVSQLATCLRRRAKASPTAQAAPSARFNEPRGATPANEQPLELEELSLVAELPAAELPAAELPAAELPAAELPEPPAPDPPPLPEAATVFVHWNKFGLHLAPSAAHLQSVSTVHQPSWPEPLAVAG